MNFFGHHKNPMEEFAHKPTYKIFCKAGPCFSLAVREDKVVLVPCDHHHDTQHWYKDERFGSKAKDDQGHHSFALVNKATGKVIKHSVVGEHVTLVPYDPKDDLDLSLLWTESDDVGEDYRNIRKVNETKYCMDAFHGDRDHGGVKDGTRISLYECWNGDNQQWKIVPYSITCEDVIEDPTKFTSKPSNLRKTLEQVIRKVGNEKKSHATHHANEVVGHPEAWEMVNAEVVGQQQSKENNTSTSMKVDNPNSIETIANSSEHRTMSSMAQRLGKLPSKNPLLETRSEGMIFIPHWEITVDDCLTDAFSERSIELCHQWCKGIVPPQDYKELLGMGLHELYHWADYHKAQAHIFEMIAREKANLLFSGKEAEKILTEERSSNANQFTTKLEISDETLEEQKIEAIQKLEKEKLELSEKLHNLEMKCSKQEEQLKDQANSFESQLAELKKAAQTSYEKHENRIRDASITVGSLCEDLLERDSRLTTLKKNVDLLEAQFTHRLKQKMEIVIKAIMKRHQDLDWVHILEDIDRMDARIFPVSTGEVPF